MRPTQNTIIHGLLGAAVLLALLLLYPLLAHNGQSNLSPSAWGLFGGAALTLASAAFLPSLVRRWRGLPSPPPLSRSDIRFVIMVSVVGCNLAVIGVFSEMWWLMALGIGLAPLSFMFRGARQRQHVQKS